MSSLLYESQVRWRKNNKEKFDLINRNSRLKSWYGIDLTEYNRMFEQQGGCCAICNKHQTQFKRRLAVDHNHTTGKVRALLCHICNRALGYYEKQKDDFESYLIRYDIEEK